MANTQAMCSSFKGELLTGIHALGPGTGVPARTVSTSDTVKAALYVATATLNASTTVYSATGEVTNGSGAGYTAGGITVTQATAPSTSGTTGIYTPTATFQWTSFTSAAAFDTVFLYNSSQGNKAISVHTFGSQSITAGTFQLTMPAHAASTALLRIA